MWLEFDQHLIDNYELKIVIKLMKKIIILSFFFIFCSFNYGCNTVAGTAKGIVEDVKSIVPGL
tara:strand:+ start:1114 stop:1302 length:189 start_codon:yes stop_codon:yes gene_type:complete